MEIYTQPIKRGGQTVFAFANEARTMCEILRNRYPSDGWHLHTLANGLIELRNLTDHPMVARVSYS